MAAYEFDELKKKYMQFQHPVAVIKVNGESLADAKKGYPVSDIRIDLTCGFEASVAEFCVYDVYDESTGSFEFPKKKLSENMHCLDIHVNHFQFGIEVGFIERTENSEPRAVDKNIYRNVLDPFKKRLAILCFG